ncbi:hypothetical protein [Mangrovicoccus ximenensis]|uniref:hypothetical protein n=1 Tax=Mangrovicoccus ximenensis TaxID=1911570 RepID=UPI000D3C592D|nr:hypothetical protein [Mangrovicoccus ximenensis]
MAPSRPLPAPGNRPPQAPLAIVALATMLALVVFTAPLTTLDAMTAGLGLTASEQAWVMSGMRRRGAALGVVRRAAAAPLARRHVVSGQPVRAETAAE